MTSAEKEVFLGLQGIEGQHSETSAADHRHSMYQLHSHQEWGRKVVARLELSILQRPRGVMICLGYLGSEWSSYPIPSHFIAERNVGSHQKAEFKTGEAAISSFFVPIVSSLR